MTDYKKSTGSSGTMMIRDTGSTVEFWIEAGSGTFAHQMPWAYVVNGDSSGWKEYDFSGGAWRRLGSWNVTSDQTVTFKLGDTGTSGLGGPTTLSADIERGTIPKAPTLYITSYDWDSANVNANNNGDGGSSVLEWIVGYGTSSTYPQLYKDLRFSDGTATVTGLSRGTTYYFWSRMRNARGWGGWSNRVVIKTHNIPNAPSAPVMKPGQSSASFTFTDNANNGQTITDHQIGWGTSSTTVQKTLTLGSSKSGTITGLASGVTYYFWARSKNAVGWSGWSARSSTRTVAGIWIKVGTTWKLAVPYVKVNGVWKMARPWVRIYGVWKETG